MRSPDEELYVAMGDGVVSTLSPKSPRTLSPPTYESMEQLRDALVDYTSMDLPPIPGEESTPDLIPVDSQAPPLPERTRPMGIPNNVKSFGDEGMTNILRG